MRKINYLLLITLLCFCLEMTGQGTITINPNTIRHDANSYVIGTQRNHIFAQVKSPTDATNTQFSAWFNQMLSEYGAITPSFGSQRKLYRLGGNEIDGQIAPLQASWYNNPTTSPPNFQTVINTCKTQGLINANNVEPFSPYADSPNYVIMGYKNVNDYQGDKDRAVYIENSDYKGYQFDQLVGQISNKSGGNANYGKNDDLKYYLQEAVLMNADLSVTINFSSGTAQKAVDMINYIKTQYGNLSRLKYIEFGNEVSEPYIKGNRKHFGLNASNNCVEYPSKSKNRIEYAQNCFDFANQLRAYLNANGGTNVKLGVVGTTNSFWAWNDPNSANSNQDLGTLLNTTNPTNITQKLSDVIDFIIFHGYPSYPIINPADEYAVNNVPVKIKNPRNGIDYSDAEISKLILAQNPWNLEKRIPQQKAIISINTARPIKIANTEFFSHQSIQARTAHSITEALYSADNIISALKENFESSINFAFYHWQDNQSEISDNLMFKLNSSNTVLDRKPVFRVQELIANSLGSKVVESSDNFANTPQFDINIASLTNSITSETDFKYKPISYVVTKKSDGTLVILLINRSDQNVPNMSIAIPSNTTALSSTIKSYKGLTFMDTAPLPANPNASAASSLNLLNFSIDKLSINIITISPTIPTCTLGITPASPTLTNAIPSVLLTATGCTGTYTWTKPDNTTSTGATLNATAGGSYTVACSTAGCSSKSVSVLDNRTLNCPITFQSLTQNTNAVSGCSANPRTYVLSFKANTTQSTPVTINTVNLPGSQFLSASTSASPTSGAGSAILDFPAGVRTLVWTLPSITANTIYTCQFSFCFVDGTTTPVPTNTQASYSNTACTPNPQTITFGTNPCTNDVTPPVISGCPANISLTAPGVATWTAPTATDNCAVTSLIPTIASGSSFPVGITTVTYTAKDAANNMVTCSFTVTVASGNCVNSANVNTSSTGFTVVSSGAVKKFYLSNSNISAYPDPTPTPPTAYDKANTLCKNLLNSGASLATLPFNGTEYNNVKSAIVTLGRTANQYFIGCNSNTSGAVSWISGSTATVYSIPSASNGIQLVGFNPGWSPNGKGASSGFFVCEVPCINGTARIASNENQINDETESNLFTLYPNPTNDKLTVEYSLTKDSEINFGIMDMTGKTLQNRTIDGKAGTHSFVMDVSKVSEGSYILRGVTEEKSQAKKFVIIR
jgi:hypothetical protein